MTDEEAIREDSRITKLETITKRLSRRSVKKTTGLITPYPISNAVIGDNVVGTILRYMFPCDGTITKGMIHFGEKPRDNVAIDVELANELGMSNLSYNTDKQNFVITSDTSVKSGNRLSVSVESLEPITEVWIAFLWVPTINEVKAKSFLLNEILNDNQEESIPLSR